MGKVNNFYLDKYGKEKVLSTYKELDNLQENLLLTSDKNRANNIRMTLTFSDGKSHTYCLPFETIFGMQLLESQELRNYILENKWESEYFDKYPEL